MNDNDRRHNPIPESKDGHLLFTGDHLSDDAMSSLVDGDLNTVDVASVQRHLGECAQCSASVRELQALKVALARLPMAVPSRSFQLGAEYTRQPQSILDRISAWLLPALPALRAATVAIALLLVGLTVRNALVDSESTGVVQESRDFAPAAMAQSTSSPTIAASSATLETGSGAAAKAPAPASTSASSARTADAPAETSVQNDEPPVAAIPADTDADGTSDANLAQGDTEDAPSAAESAPVNEDTAAGGNDAAADSDSAGATSAFSVAEASPAATLTATTSPTLSPTTTPTPSPTATATATATIVFTPTLSPAPSATATPAPSANAATDSGPTAWEWLQWVLGGALVLAVLAILVAQRAKTS